MASNIDETQPIDNQVVEKALIRGNFAAAKQELEELQEQVSVAWLIALGQLSL